MIPKLSKAMLAANMHQKSIKIFVCRRFFIEMTPPGFKNVSEGRPRGHPATLRQAFLGPDGWSYVGLVGLKSHSEALRRLKVPHEALRGAPRRYFYTNFSKIKCGFQIDLGISFRCFSRSSLGTNHTTRNTQTITTHGTQHTRTRTKISQMI